MSENAAMYEKMRTTRREDNMNTLAVNGFIPDNEQALYRLICRMFVEFDKGHFHETRYLDSHNENTMKNWLDTFDNISIIPGKEQQNVLDVLWPLMRHVEEHTKKEDVLARQELAVAYRLLKRLGVVAELPEWVSPEGIS